MITTDSRANAYEVPRKTVAESVTDRLRHLILAGELPDGIPLRQDALAEEMGTSRIPVREALSRLENEGLVASYPHRGYVVTGLSSEEIEELYDLRMILEPDLIRYAIPNLTSNDLMVIEKVLADFHESIETQDVNSRGEQNRQFHMALYGPSRRTKTLDIVRSLLVNTDRYSRLILSFGDRQINAEEEHKALVEYFRKGQVNQAMALARDHIEQNRNELIEILHKEKERE